MEQSDHRHRRLLRARRERPCGRAAEERDELAPLHSLNHSITSSARSGNAGGIVTLAVLRLMTSSNLIDWCTGNSAGLAPLRNLSGVNTSLAISVRNADPICHQPVRGCETPLRVPETPPLVPFGRGFRLG